MISDNKTLDRVYTAKNHDELMDAYKDWASDYDADLAEFGYVAHSVSARALDTLLDSKQADILDAGCGTGLVAEQLQALGYQQLDALDYSREMLDEAERKGLYQRYLQADLSRPLDLDSNRYDAIVCTGTFTYGHVTPSAFNELIRITRPGGYICFTVREGAYEDHGYAQRMGELEERGDWTLLDVEEADYLKQEGVRCKVFSYRVDH